MVGFTTQKWVWSVLYVALTDGT